MGKLGITFLALLGFFLGIHADGSQPVLNICVPEINWNDCVNMMKDSAAKGISVSCIAGRDRYECLEKVGRKEADIVAVDPEDMYLAAKNNFANDPGYNVVEQIRTKEEPDKPNRYEGVVVVRKDLEIFDVQGLRGLNSCHTGVGRTVGFKVPITKLTEMGVFENINDPEYSARENEIRALSTLFNKGCLVGTWSPDPEINKKLKEKYSNMCALCEDPVKCDYPDKFSGYDGALRCLAYNGGQVAFTNVISVKRFFGLPVGKTPAVPTNENPSDFAYFCPDGTKVPIDKDTKPCTWAARPWQGYMTNGQVYDVPSVQKTIEQLGALGEQENATWWANVLLLNENSIPVSIEKVQPAEYLEECRYLDVIARDSGAPGRDARWCVWDDESLAKCQALAEAAYSRDVRPRFNCVLEKNQESCLATLSDEGADLVVLPGWSVERAIMEFDVRPIIAENYTTGSTKFDKNYEDSYYGYEPSRIIVTHAGKSDNAIDELINGVLAAATVFTNHRDVFQLFGSWNGHRNVLFNDNAIGLVSLNNMWDRWD